MEHIDNCEQRMSLSARKRIRDLCFRQHKIKMQKSSNRALFDVPDYLKAFNSVNFNDVQRIARTIIDGTYDWQKDEDKINIMIYSALNKYEKPFFKSLYLKNIDQKVLDGEINYSM